MNPVVGARLERVVFIPYFPNTLNTSITITIYFVIYFYISALHQSSKIFP